MSLFKADPNTLARRLWPASMTARLPADPVASDTGPWQIVPLDYDDLCSWVTVDRDERGGTTHPFMLLYAPEVSPINEGRLKVTLRVYGIVDALSISPTGNYTGRKEAAPKSVQFVSLCPGPWPNVFEPQMNALSDIRAYIGTVLGCNVADSTRKPGTIYIQRKVFTKVRRDATNQPRSALVFGDDPNRWTSAIKNDWVVAHKIFTGVYDENGKAVKRPYTVIRPGDFVEVVCTVEIARFRKRSGWATETRLVLQEVTHVIDKAAVEAAKPPVETQSSMMGDETFVSSFFDMLAVMEGEEDNFAEMQS